MYDMYDVYDVYDMYACMCIIYEWGFGERYLVPGTRPSIDSRPNESRQVGISTFF